MNVAEYIEQNMDDTSCTFTVYYHDFAKAVGLQDKIDVITELVGVHLQELYTCEIIMSTGLNDIQSRLIQEFFWTEQYVTIEFSHWIYKMRIENEHWLSDIWQQTRMNNYTVKGD